MIKLFKVRMAESAPEMVKETLESGMIGEGPKCVQFKKKLEEHFNCQNLLLLNSGTSAITLALRLIGVEGAEVISTPFTMIATNVAIKAAGAEVVFADIEKTSVLISYESIKSKITPKTKAIVVVLVGGIAPDLQKICSLGLPVVIDAAHGIDTLYKGRHISSWGDFVCFSFQSIKHLTTGDGGALVVRDDSQYQRAERLKWFGMQRAPEGVNRLRHQMESDVSEWGYKYHMNDIAATIGLANLGALSWAVKVHRTNAEYYIRHLPTPPVREDCVPSWWAFYLLVKNREEFMQKLADADIETTPMWRRNDEYSCFKKADLPNMTALQDKIVFIPVGWWIPPREIRHITQTIKKWLK